MKNQFILTPFFLDEPSPALETLAQPGWQINKPALPNADKQQRMSAIHQPIAAFVADTLAKGNRPVSVAGDCCTTLGFLAGLQRAGLSPTLLWLDAHGDFNTWETTPSGFLGGMPLAMMVGRGELTMANAVGLKPFPESQIVLCDGRDLDPPERVAVNQSQLQHVRDVETLPVHPLINRPLWIHFDTDILNLADAPAMSYPAVGGPSAAQLKALFEQLKSRSIVAVSMTTWTPRLDTDGQSQRVCMELLNVLTQGDINAPLALAQSA
jgi:arginase